MVDYSFTPEEETLRQEVRSFLMTELGPDFHDEGHKYQKDYSFEKEYLKKLAARKYIVPGWPTEYGGMGLGVMKQTIFNEEMFYFNSPHYPLTGNGSDLVGPVLMLYGTDEQKKEHLPLIAAGQRIWGQGFSEPNAGSDLASLSCKATMEGDDFVINGTKIWTTDGHLAEWMFILVRTDPEAPKHRGISFLIFDMNTPGVSVHPLIDAAGEHRINQEFFEDVRVPKKNLIGELNRGWYVAAATLDFERSGIGYVAANRRRLDDLIKYAKETKVNGQRLIDQHVVQTKLAQVRIEVECARFISYRVSSMQEAGQIPNYEASIAKMFGSEVQQRFARIGTEILGLYGHVLGGDRRAKMHGDWGRWYVNTIPDTIEAGSSEIQRNVIATRGLGLPRI